MIVIRTIYILLLFYSFFVYKKVSKTFQFVIIMIWITILHESVAFFFKINGMPNTFGMHLFSIALVPAFYLIHQSMLKNISGWKWVQLLYGVVFTFCILNSTFIQSANIIPSYNLNALSLLVITCCMLYYLNMLKEPDASPLKQQSKFWMNTAVMCYYASSFVIITLANYFHSNNYSKYALKYMNIVMCCLYYSALGYSLWLNTQERKNA